MTGPLVLQEVSPDDEAALRAWYDLRIAEQEADRPGDPRLGWWVHVGHLRHPWPGSQQHAFLTLRGAHPVGWLGIDLPTRENLDTLVVDVHVAPGARRRGAGRTMLDEAVRRCHELGRTRLILEVPAGPGELFAAAHGARRVLVDTQRRLDLRTLDDPRLDALLADARRHAAGYSLVQWAGSTPEEHVEALAALDSRMTTDAPMDDLAWEQEVFDAERVRQSDAMNAVRRNRSYISAVRHDATGELVGYTRLAVSDGVDDAAEQWATIVSPQHRGNRLGLLLKVANLRLLQEREPAVTQIDTFNADSNAPMLRVNEAMGFRPVRQWGEWELRLSR